MDTFGKPNKNKRNCWVDGEYKEPKPNKTRPVKESSKEQHKLQ